MVGLSQLEADLREAEDADVSLGVWYGSCGCECGSAASGVEDVPSL